MSKRNKKVISPSQIWHRMFGLKLIRKSLKKCDSTVILGHNFTISGNENISIGSYTSIGPNAVLYATMAPLTIGKYVMIAPNVTIVTGEHRTDIIGEYMRNITESQKLPENDQPVVIEDDVWIGSNVTILKGVTIGRGSIIHAGCVIAKNIKPYTIYISEKIKISRFSEEEIIEHEKLLVEKYGEN